MGFEEQYYCGSCDRILEEEDGEIKTDTQGNLRCPVCGEKVTSVDEANRVYAKIEADLAAEDEKNKKCNDKDD